MLCEQLRYNLLFRWFVGLGMDERVWVPTTLTKDRDRLLGGDVARAFFSGVVAEARKRRWLSAEPFTVDGTLLEAYASQKSFRPKGEPPDSWPRSTGGGRNPEVDFRGEKRSNETHESRTDPDARLARKKGKESRLSSLANTLMENRSGLIVDAEVRHATGTAEWEAALARVDRLPARRRRRTLGADKGYDTRAFVGALRERNVTPHVAQNTSGRRSAIDGRTTRHAGDAASQQKRKLIEQGFGWQKTVGLRRKLRHRGLRVVQWLFTLTAAAYNLVSMRSLLLGEVRS